MFAIMNITALSLPLSQNQKGSFFDIKPNRKQDEYSIRRLCRTDYWWHIFPLRKQENGNRLICSSSYLIWKWTIFGSISNIACALCCTSNIRMPRPAAACSKWNADIHSKLCWGFLWNTLWVSGSIRIVLLYFYTFICFSISYWRKEVQTEWPKKRKTDWMEIADSVWIGRRP